MKADTESEVVYLIGDRTSGRVKIGRSVNANERIRDIQAMSPIALEILWTHSGGAALETQLHRHFGGRRLHGEWFEFDTAEEAVTLIAAAVPAVLAEPHLPSAIARAKLVREQRELARAAKLEEHRAARQSTHGPSTAITPLSSRAVAGILGVKPETLRFYRAHSKPGGRYEQHPFPAPDYDLDGRPAWKAEREQEIIDWAANRPGQGAGGGRPTQRKASDQ